MEELIKLGIDNNELEKIISGVNNINLLSNDEVKDKINYLISLNASIEEIKNIIICNPSYLDRLDKDVKNLVNCLIKYGFINLNTLFDSNPFILNLDAFEVDNYINERLKNEELEIIVNDLIDNPDIFNEI